MATVQKRTWLSRGPSGRRVRKVSWGYDARTALAHRILAKDRVKTRPTTRAEAAER